MGMLWSLNFLKRPEMATLAQFEKSNWVDLASDHYFCPLLVVLCWLNSTCG